MAAAIQDFLRAAGLPLDSDPNLVGTPERVAEAWASEFLDGYARTPEEALGETFPAPPDSSGELVVVTDLRFHSMCPHHLLPFTGRAHVAYLPDGKVVGLSTLARLVEGYARRPQVQERLTTQIADALMEELNPIGAACVIEAVHTCMTIRGAKKHGSTMVTSALRGIFKENPASRSEILSLMHFTNGVRQ